MNPLPPSLARHGLTSATDNLPDGGEIKVSAYELAHLFGAQLWQALHEKNASDLTTNDGA